MEIEVSSGDGGVELDFCPVARLKRGVTSPIVDAEISSPGMGFDFLGGLDDIVAMGNIFDESEGAPALVLVDIQEGFDDLEYWGGGRNNLQAEENGGRILQYFRERKWPVFHIQHCSPNAGCPLEAVHPGNKIKLVVASEAGEAVITKNVNSSFIGTDLKERLEQAGLKTLVVVGLTTDHCVSTTVRMAGNYGFRTFVVEDATATFDKLGPDGERYEAQLIHDTALASLHNEFATVVKTEEVVGVS